MSVPCQCCQVSAMLGHVGGEGQGGRAAGTQATACSNTNSRGGSSSRSQQIGLRLERLLVASAGCSCEPGLAAASAMSQYLAKLRRGKATAPELPDLVPQAQAGPLKVHGPAGESDPEPAAKEELKDIKQELKVIKQEQTEEPLPAQSRSDPARRRLPGKARPTAAAAERRLLQDQAEPASESPLVPPMAFKRRRLWGKAGPTLYKKFGYSAPPPPLAQLAEPAAPRSKQPRPLNSLPRGSPEHNYLETRRLPAFVAKAAGATDMEAVAESLKNFAAIQAPLAELGSARGRGIKITIGTLCSGSEMYLTSFAELQGAIRAATGVEVCLDHAWSCEFVRWKREWIWRNFAPRRIFVDAADLSSQDGAYDDVSGCKQPVEIVGVLIAGFSCKDASTLNVHHRDRKDCIKSGAGTTGSTFRFLLDVVKKQQPLLVILENVASLNAPADCGRSNLDFVIEAFADIGYKLVWRIFDAADAGAPGRRRRIYMTAYKACQALVEQDAAQAAVDFAVDRMCGAAEQHHLDDFLFADAVVPSWSPHVARFGRGSWKQKHAPHWKKAKFAADKSTYRKSLAENPSFAGLSARQQDLLLLHLCSFAFPGPAFGAIGLNHGCKLARYSSSLPTQLPSAQYWLFSRSRLQLGAEAMVLQGADLADLPACRPGGPFTDRQLQNLAGNAFHVWQFVIWFLATCEAIQF